MNTNIIQLKDVCKNYEMGEQIVRAVCDVNLEIKKGDFIKTDPKFLALALTGILNSFVTYSSETDHELDYKKTNELVKKIFFGNVLSPKRLPNLGPKDV